MGLFDKVSGIRRPTQITLGPAEAFMVIALIAIGSDGFVAETEIQAIQVAISRMKLFNSYPSDVIRKMINNLLGIMERQGANTLLNAAVAVLPHDLNETAFAVATDIILADGEITEEEETLLNHLYQVLEITEDTATKIVDVMLIKNRG
ncbi:tellurite resistance TerB family protein [Chroococcidiopsis sp. TS-821]|uniref:tellurite resistance TerB family protein n=1 Tax=Chroococcidiopsis sp. TS-821 TaxID=1378066 RepID=UPI000CEF3ECB|nr:tellurite resistance TerB family protein [Chroococcidiopsis sp. TS-821]PPS43289.1 Tellurite resistance protein TerB [Chroococcidiopsis sp. TS-821]